MRIGIFPDKCPMFSGKVNTSLDYYEMGKKIYDELYVQKAVSCLADLLCDWLLVMGNKNE